MLALNRRPLVANGPFLSEQLFLPLHRIDHRLRPSNTRDVGKRGSAQSKMQDYAAGKFHRVRPKTARPKSERIHSRKTMSD